MWLDIHLRLKALRSLNLLGMTTATGRCGMLHRRTGVVEDSKLVIIIWTDFSYHERLKDGANFAEDGERCLVEDARTKVVVEIVTKAFHKGAVCVCVCLASVLDRLVRVI
jgi:hypothetical protein